MKKFILSIVCTVFCFALFAQGSTAEDLVLVSSEDFQDTILTKRKSDYWKFSGIAGLSFSQVNFWNWSAGGNNSANGRLFANLTLAYKKEKLSWISNLDTEFGLMYTPTTSHTWRKPNDKIIFTTKLGYEFSKSWFVAVMGGFSSQYAKGYEYKIEADKTESKTYISNWLSPSYTDLSIGVDWQPNDIFTVYLSPVAGRLTTCTVEELRPKYSVQGDDSFLLELGLTLKAGVKYSAVKNLLIISNITFYTPYTSKVQKFGNIDVNWDVAVSYQFLKVLSVSVGTSLIYRDQVMITDKNGNTGPRVQFMEMVGLGLSYMF